MKRPVVRDTRKELVALVNYYSTKAGSLNERIVMKDSYIVLDTETGNLTDETETWFDVVIRPGAMSLTKKNISYERMYQILDEFNVENAEIFKTLNRYNYRSWLIKHRDITYRSCYVDS